MVKRVFNDEREDQMDDNLQQVNLNVLDRAFQLTLKTIVNKQKRVNCVGVGLGLQPEEHGVGHGQRTR